MKLTPAILRKLVMEEVAKLKSDALDADLADETDADEYADSLEHHIDFVKALKIKEARLKRELKQISERKNAAYQKILKIK